MRAWLQRCNHGTISWLSPKRVPFETRSRSSHTRSSYQRRRPAAGWKQRAEEAYRWPFAASNRNTHYTSGTTQWGPLQSVIPFSQEAVLILVPIVIVAIPWLVEHWQLVVVVTAVVFFGPFGAVLSGFLQDLRLLRPVIDVEVMPDEPPTSSRPVSEQTHQRERPLPMSYSRTSVRRAEAAPVRRRRVFTRRAAVQQENCFQQAPVQRRDERQTVGGNEHYWRLRKERKSVWVAIFSRLPFIRRWGGFL